MGASGDKLSLDALSLSLVGASGSGAPAAYVTAAAAPGNWLSSKNQIESNKNSQIYPPGSW